MTDQPIEHGDEIPAEVDFSGAERGKIYRRDVLVSVPVRLRLSRDLMDFLVLKAENKGVSLDDLISEVVEKEIAVVQAIG